MGKYIHQHKNWSSFHWEQEKLLQPLAEVHRRQGKILGRMEALGFTMRSEAMLQTLTQDVIKSSEIEGDILNQDQVRSSIARRLGMNIVGLVPSNKNIDGVVEMMLDATQGFDRPLTNERLFGWQASLFPTGWSGIYKVKVGAWRDGAMHVVSGAMGREHIHFEAPEADKLNDEMGIFLNWFNTSHDTDPVLKAAIAHLWFVTIHPFDDGNGRIARAIADMQLARADGSHQRFYSMSSQILLERKNYYDILESTQKGTPNITDWLVWFLACLGRALDATEETFLRVVNKTQFWDSHRETPFNERQRLMLNKLLDGFDGKLTTSKWAKITKCSSDTALRDIQNLMDKNILVQDGAGGRSTGYQLQEHEAD